MLTEDNQRQLSAWATEWFLGVDEALGFDGNDARGDGDLKVTLTYKTKKSSVIFHEMVDQREFEGTLNMIGHGLMCDAGDITTAELRARLGLPPLAPEPSAS